jgi:Uma2 family endonuclease
MGVLTAPPPIKQWTYADYLTLPDDGTRHEILEGELIVMDAPTPSHQEVVLFIARHMQEFVESKKLGKVFIAPLDVVFAPRTFTQPDVIFVSNDRLKIITNSNISGAPDLLVEVVSPSTQRKDRTRKYQLYARYGVRAYWIVDRDTEAVDVFVLEQGQYREVTAKAGEVRSKILHGFSIQLKDLFA